MKKERGWLLSVSRWFVKCHLTNIRGRSLLFIVPLPLIKVLHVTS